MMRTIACSYEALARSQTWGASEPTEQKPPIRDCEKDECQRNGGDHPNCNDGTKPHDCETAAGFPFPSAGTTFMSFFARDNRYVTRGSRLMIHERKLSKTLTIDGPLTMCLATVRATLNEIECSIAIQNEGFENLVRGSQVTIEEVLEKAPNNWYVEAEEAKRLGLIEAVL